MKHDFRECKTDADRYAVQWDHFWKRFFPKYKITRGFATEVDKVGLDVKLEMPNNERMLIDEKISYWLPPNYPVEIMSNSEQKKLGWAYTNKDYVAMVHVANGCFIDKPILFKCDSDKFRSRILNNPLFSVFTTQTECGEGLSYTTVGKAVPLEWLKNFEDDVWFDRQIGNDKQSKLWYY